MARIGYDKDEYFNMVENSMFVDIGIEFDIEAYKFLSWVTRLVRILLVKSSKAY